MPEALRVKGRIDEKEEFLIIAGESSRVSCHQILRNLVFHLPDLCRNMGIHPAKPEREIDASDEQHFFDVNANYPRIAAVRNAELNPRIQALLSSWCDTPMLERWHAPSADELHTACKDDPEPELEPEDAEPKRI